MVKQLNAYFENILPKYQCGFRKGYSAQQSLISMNEKLKNTLGKGGTSAALLTDFSKALECLPPHLLIAKLHVYRIQLSSLRFLYSYLVLQKQRLRDGTAGSACGQKVCFGFYKDLSLGLDCSACSYAIYFCLYQVLRFQTIRMTTQHTAQVKISEVIDYLEKASETLLAWIKNNSMKANPDKYLLDNSKDGTYTIKAGNKTIPNSKCEKLLGIKN